MYGYKNNIYIYYLNRNNDDTQIIYIIIVIMMTYIAILPQIRVVLTWCALMAPGAAAAVSIHITSESASGL